MAKKSMTEKVLDIFVGTVARDLSRTVVKRAKEALNQNAGKKRLKRKPENDLPDEPASDLEP